MEKIIVANFGPIKHAELEIKKFTIFIGNQASGKSTIAKLLAIFNDLEFIIGEEPIRDKFDKYLKEYNIYTYLRNDTSIEYISDNYRIICSKLINIELNQDFQDKITRERERVMALLSGIAHKRNPNNKIEAGLYLNSLYQSNWKYFFNLITEQTYIPAERNLLSLVSENPFSIFSNFSLPKCITNFGLKYESARNSIKELYIDFLGIKYKLEDGHQRIYHSDKDFIDISESASGFQYSIPLIIVVSEGKVNGPNSYIIEEPELSLFPTTQRDLLRFIVSEINKYSETKLLLTTHSPYVLSIFNNMMFAHRVWKRNIEKETEISQVIDKSSWIDSNEFSAYSFENGTAREVIDENRMITENDLDAISIDLSGELDKLLELYE